jgi:AraC-like DNA-binding protein
MLDRARMTGAEKGMPAHVESTRGNGEASRPRLAMTVVADQTTGGLPDCRLRRVTQYIQDNLHREVRLAELSGLVHMSPYYFARLFKRSTGVSPHRFVSRRRIEQASALLAAQTLPIAEIARSVRFRTPSHFATTFRRVTGVPPRVYRSGGEAESTKAARATIQRGEEPMRGWLEARVGRPITLREPKHNGRQR